MATQRVAKRTAFLNADKSKLVAEDSPDAAFLFVREGSAIRDNAEADRLGYTDFEDAALYDAGADHERKHGGETQQQADAKSVESSRATTAVTRAPANKSAE
jgi:hypothetical protein